jgi:hypothetical protein
MKEPDAFEPIEIEDIPEIQFRPSNIKISKFESGVNSNPFEMIPEEDSGFVN